MTHLVAALSGVAWALLLVSVFDWYAGPLWLGVLASPLIGVLIGMIIKPFRDVDWQVTIVFSLRGLYVAAGLFALTGGIALAPPPGQIQSLHPAPRALLILEAVLETWWGMSFTGLVFLLWPLSWANHEIIWFLQRREEERRPSAV